MTNFIFSKSYRLQKLRRTENLRRLLQETEINVFDLILPLFIHFNPDQKKPIASMPGHFQLGLNHLDEEINLISTLKIPGVMIFGIPKEKDAQGSDAYSDDGIIQQAIRKIKTLAPNLLVFADCCFCEYTDHGHCGMINPHNHEINHEQTLESLMRVAVAQAQAGADIIAPSGMIDGMVGAIRYALDQHGFKHIPILSYAVKYASSLYGPFREAAEGAPQFGNRKSYQMNPANQKEALREAALDIEQGADMLMVKPGIFYLDVLHQLKCQYPEIPLAVYQVSGEYAMIKAAAEKAWLSEHEVMMESLISLKRAGADFIITYFAKEAAKLCVNITNF